jgi:hypothetical protein
MFGKLKEAAAAGASAAVAAGTSVANAAEEKLDEGVAAKKMVDEGGETMAQKLLAKKASWENQLLDKQIMLQVSAMVSKYEDTIAQLEASAASAEDECPGFDILIRAYGSRAEKYKMGLAELQDASVAPNALDVSNVEYHAINLVCLKKGMNGITKEQAGGLFQNVKESAGGYKVLGMGPYAGSLSVLGDRFSAAMPGKELVDEGGQPVALKLLAKAATLTAVAMDKKLFSSLGEAIDAYTNAAYMCEALVATFPEEPFAKAGKEYASRSEAYKRKLFFTLGTCNTNAVASMTPEEKNGALYAETIAAFFKARNDIVNSAQAAHGQAKQGYQEKV